MQQGFDDLRKAVGGLANRFGFDLEEFVAALLPPYLDRHYGIVNLTPLERRFFDLNGGQPEEVDLFGTGQRDGRPVTILVECRTKIGGGAVREIAEKLAPLAATIEGSEVVSFIVAMNIHPTAEAAAKEIGILVIPYSRVNREGRVPGY